MQPKVNNQDLLSRLNLQGLDEQARNQLINNVAQLIQTRFSLRLTEKLSDDQLKQLDEMTGQGKVEEAEARVRSMVPNYDELLSLVTEEVIGELAESKQYLKDRVNQTK